MVQETNRACFERVRRERESRDRTIGLHERYGDRTNFSDASCRDVARPIGMESKKGERARNM